MPLRMKSCSSYLPSCSARGSDSLRKERRHAHSSSSARKQPPPASSSVLTRSPPFEDRINKESVKMAKNTICLWYERDAEEAARFYAKTFPNSSVGAVRRAPSDYPDGKKGDALIVEFSVAGIPC